MRNYPTCLIPIIRLCVAFITNENAFSVEGPNIAVQGKRVDVASVIGGISQDFAVDTVR